MYQVLYRKWRPKTFDDVVGQEHITGTLKNELKIQHMSHAYLFTGSRGTGKTSCAKILAKAVNCLNLQNGNPCGECNICIGVESGSILDVTEIDAASNNGVENIRLIREEASFTPTIAKYRVYIIDEVHMLSIGAFNALLKMLEEPPSHVMFILATTEAHKIPVTILSRCQKFDFNRISIKAMKERIEYICKQENIEISKDAALQISKFSDGALRDALSILDQCISKGGAVSLDTVLNAIGISGSKNIFKIISCIFKNDSTNVLKTVEELYSKSKDMSKLCEELLECFRDIMIFKIVGEESDYLLSYNVEEELFINGKELDATQIIGCIEQLQSAYEQIQKGFNKKFELELCLLKLCNATKRKSSNEKALKNESKGESKEECKNESKSESKEECKKNPCVIDAHINHENGTLENAKGQENNLVKMELWPDVLNMLKAKAKSMALAFKDSNAYEKGNYILIDSQSTLAFELLREPANRNQMRNVIKEVTGKYYNLGPYKKAKEGKASLDKLEEFSNIVKDAGININLKVED